MKIARIRRTGVRVIAAGLLLSIAPVAVLGQSEIPKQAPAAAPPPAAKSAAPPTAQSSTKRVQVPMDQALLLVRATLLTLNDANRSGNYTVLRDLGSPEFQSRNTAADLGLVFAEMRKSNLSLYSVLLLSPQLTSAPELDNDGRLRVSGFVPTRPQQVKFDLVYEQAAGQWKLLNLGISTAQEQSRPPEQQQSAPQAAQQPKPPAAETRAAPAPTAVKQRVPKGPAAKSSPVSAAPPATAQPDGESQ